MEMLGIRRSDEALVQTVPEWTEPEPESRPEDS